MNENLSPLLAFAAGALSILSPCVLPLIPVIFGTARNQSRFGWIALGAGLAASFTGIGLFVATIGFSIGFDGGFFRSIGGVLMIAFGAVLVLPLAQLRLASAAAPLGSWANARLTYFDGKGVGGQALLGAILGLVWVPCVGPTLGAASLLAAQGENLGQVGLVMLAFGIGAATPLMLIGLASASAIAGLRQRLGRTATAGKLLLGLSLLVLGTLILTGWDRSLEIWLTQASPDWLVDLTTRY